MRLHEFSKHYTDSAANLRDEKYSSNGISSTKCILLPPMIFLIYSPFRNKSVINPFVLCQAFPNLSGNEICGQDSSGSYIRYTCTSQFHYYLPETTDKFFSLLIQSPCQKILYFKTCHIILNVFSEARGYSNSGILIIN